MASKRVAAHTEREKAVSAAPKPKKKKPSPPKVSNCGCKVYRLQNPFNILKEYNVNCARAARDRCLMDNIFKIKDLRGRLEKRYIFYCCEVSVKLKDMIPGIVKCPVPGCGATQSLSWCRDDSFQSSCRGMKHCEKCRDCVDEGDRHCDDCNTCYFECMSCFCRCPCKGPDETGRFPVFVGYFPELVSKDMVGWSADLSGDECRGDISFEWLVDSDSSEEEDNVGRSVGDGNTGGINNNRLKDSDSSSSEDSDIVGDSLGNGYTGGINNDWSEDNDSSEDSF
ncbi:Hypp5250 [Branchiostoma lanceolatum]|uniref:Hypp5250 protein n=1 Tax=Branchiostoma lanceolatum TaxID=7740 RepID=A0A8K0AEF2_BRALA|nr:Hypp5250 [Branchiostoma lanceolatum]